MGFTKIKEIFKNIKHTKSSFFSIMMFILLGVGIFQGFDYTANAMLISTDNAFKIQNSYDILIPYTLGCHKDELNEFLANEHVSDAEGYYTAHEYFELNGEVHASAIHSLTNSINKAEIIEGRFPEADGEIVIVKDSAKKFNLKVDDVLHFTEGSGYANYLISQLRDIGTRDDLDKISEDVVSNFLTSDFTIVGIVSHPSYFTRGISVYGTYPNSAVQVELIGFVDYSSFNPRITNGYYNNVLLRCEELDEYKCFGDEYGSKVAEIIDDIRPIADDIASRRYEICKGNIDKVVSNDKLIEKVATELKNLNYLTQEQYENISETKSQIYDYSNDLSKVESARILSRKENSLFFYGLMTSDVIFNVKYSLGGIFVVVALLICFSSISRIVGDDMKIIGAKKALGFKNSEIFFTYLGYTLLSAIIGLIAGNLFALLVEYLLVPSASSAFAFETIRNYFDPLLSAIVAGGILLAIALMTLLACASAVKKNAIDLLKGNVAKTHGKAKFYEKTKAWEKLPLVQKSMINNAVTDKKRCFATIVGVAASACMMIGSITMNRNILGGFEDYSSNNYKFDYFVFFDPECDDCLYNLMSYFEEKNIDASPVYRDQSYINPGDEKMLISYMMVYSDYETFGDVVGIDSSSPNDFENSGFWIPESIKHTYKLSEGEKAIVTNSMGDQAPINVAGYYKNYSYILTTFISKIDYENAYGNAPKENTVVVNLRGLDVESIKNDLNQIDGYKLIFDYEGFVKETVDVFASVANIIVGMYIVVCVLMGFFVILNLLITFVSEKKRDLITLLINGYSYKQACAYIYVDTIFLTVIGLILGTISGIGLGVLVIGAFESGSIYLPHAPNIIAILIGCGVTSLLVFGMTMIALRKIKKFKLTDINSSSI